MSQATKNNHTPSFITIEGGEGAGKSSLIELLKATLMAWGYHVITTREPGGTPLGNEIRSLVLTHKLKIDPKAELLLMLAARAQHIDEVILPSLQQGKIVLCDRFNDSTIAYQGAARGLGEKWVGELCHSICGKTVPDLTFYLDVTPEIGLERTKRLDKQEAQAGQLDRIEMEKLAFHHTVRQAFLTIAHNEPKRVCLINANAPQQEVSEEALAVLNKYFRT